MTDTEILDWIDRTRAKIDFDDETGECMIFRHNEENNYLAGWCVRSAAASAMRSEKEKKNK